MRIAGLRPTSTSPLDGAFAVSSIDGWLAGIDSTCSGRKTSRTPHSHGTPLNEHSLQDGLCSSPAHKLHTIRQRRHGLCVGMENDLSALSRAVCSCSQCGEGKAAVGYSHFLRLRLQFQQPVLVRTCLALGLRRAVWAGRESRARRLPTRGEAEALSSAVMVACGTCSAWMQSMIRLSSRRWLQEPTIVCNDDARPDPVTSSKVRCSRALHCRDESPTSLPPGALCEPPGQRLYMTPDILTLGDGSKFGEYSVRLA